MGGLHVSSSGSVPVPLQLDMPSNNQQDIDILSEEGNGWGIMPAGNINSEDSYTPPKIINRRATDNINLKSFSTVEIDKLSIEQENELISYLSNEVNRDGKAPLLLRPLAALLALFGIHGFGQTNCASCATAVIDTLENKCLYQALPELRGADVKGNMGGSTHENKSVAELTTILKHYDRDEALYGVLVIKRPALWSILPWMTEGHACNVIKFEGSNFIHFLDAQKRTYVRYDLSLYKEVEFGNRGEQSRLLCQKNQEAMLSKFLGSVGTDGIDLYEKNFKYPDNKRPEHQPQPN
ncbi:TPA: hypothetical protein ACQ301_004043 [Yersinia enterocolitica]